MIVVDASFALKLVLHEVDSPKAHRLWQAWVNAGETMLAPSLFLPEMYSSIRRNAYRGVLSQGDADNAYHLVGRLPLTLTDPANLYDEAWSLAKRFNRPTIYDCCYLALASLTGFDFWTADMRLVNAVGPSLSFVHAL